MIRPLRPAFSLAPVAVAAVLFTLAACKSGPVLAEKIGQVARVRVDSSDPKGHAQYFVDAPKDVADLLAALGTSQHIGSGARFGEKEFPSVGLTFFDAQGMPHATLNFSGPIGSHNELYAIGDDLTYLGAVTPADSAALGKVIARAAPPAAP